MILNIGALKHRLGILARPQVPSDQAGINYNNTLLATVWGYIEPAKGSKYLYRQQIDEAITHKIYIRYLPWVTAENWLVYKKGDFKSNINTANDALIENISFRIRGVKDIWQLQRFLELSCEEQYQT